MLRDNDSILNSIITPQGIVNKIHTALSFNLFREAIAANIISYQFIKGRIYHVDILSKNWAHHCTWPTLEPLLFWKGDAMEF